MNTLTVQLPDSIDPAAARWELARSLYEKEQLTLEEAAKLAGLAPTYFTIRMHKLVDSDQDQTRQDLLAQARPLDRSRFDELVNQLSIEEPWSKLVSQIGK